MHNASTKTTALVAALLATSALAHPNLLPRDHSAAVQLGTNCAADGATDAVTPGAGPNGAQAWFNRGIDDGSGWAPPHLPWDSVVHITADAFYAGAGAACRQYDALFRAAGAKHDIDPAVLACIAMQESSCDAHAGGSTPGLMQVACENYPAGRCTDSVADNVDAGAKYLRTQLDANDQNAIAAIGSYNGWFSAGDGMNGGKGLTRDYPCSSEGRRNGDPQNLDYIQQTLNGWFLGLNPYGSENWIGTEHCTGQCSSGSHC